MAKGGNSLQAVLNRAKADGDAAPAPAPAIEPVDVSRKAPPSGRQGTKLIGGHFPRRSAHSFVSSRPRKGRPFKAC